MPETTELHEDLLMADLAAAYPAALQALSSRYHVGGCSGPSFRPDETLRMFLARHFVLDVKGVLATIRESRETAERILVTPEEAARLLAQAEPPVLIDVRGEEEFRMVGLPQARHLDHQTTREILSSWPKDRAMLFCCHRGDRAMEAAVYFEEHGFTRVKAIQGGLDAWSERVDPLLPRYDRAPMPDIY